ncbi:MAG TPA: exosome complex RNA-binding protein Rrp4 [Thermoplasmata archaeon]|nr:exosome complex RNA-binding protein Rrp4 [Thermoplasmata archaeon]
MGNGHRPHRRGRGREGRPSHGSSERILVLPGEEIPARGLRPGSGTYRMDGRIYASVLGLLQPRPPFVRVAPLSGRYIPKAQDTVIGIVTDVQGTFWLLDIGAPRWAPLHMTGTPWKMDFGETDQYLRVGDAVVVQVEQIENTGRIGVTMLGDGLGKLEGGTLAMVAPAKIPRVVGKGGSMIQSIQRATGCRVVVGQNGRLWVDGPDEGILKVREALHLIEEEGQRRGLTERVQQFLGGGTTSSDDPGHAVPPRDPNAPSHPPPPPPAEDLEGGDFADDDFPEQDVN